MKGMVQVDTDILVDAGRQIPIAVQFLQNLEQQYTLAISVITELELVVGCHDKHELNKVSKFLKRFEVIPLEQVTSSIVTNLIRQYRLSHGLLIPDALIAATAMARGLPFFTKNQRDYRFITGLNLLPYP